MALTKRGLLWEHPGSSRVWTPNKDEWLTWVGGAKHVDLVDLTEIYPVDLDDLGAAENESEAADESTEATT